MTWTTPNVRVLPTGLLGVKDLSITQPRVILVTVDSVILCSKHWCGLGGEREVSLGGMFVVLG